MLEYLFGSKTRLKLLRVFFRDPDAVFFVRELSRLCDVQINAIRRELTTLLTAGILEAAEADAAVVHTGTRHKYYRLNVASPLYDDLRSLLIKAQIMGEQALVEKVKRLGTVSLVLLSGRFVGVPDLPTDLLVVGSVTDGGLKRVVAQFERELGGAIRYTLMSQEEFKERKHMMDRFTVALLDGKHIVAHSAI